MEGLSETDTGKCLSIKDRQCVLLAFLPCNCFLCRKSKASDSHTLVGRSKNLIILQHLSFSKVKEQYYCSVQHSSEASTGTTILLFVIYRYIFLNFSLPFFKIRKSNIHSPADYLVLILVQFYFDMHMPTVSISNGSKVSQNHTFKLSINLAPYI